MTRKRIRASWAAGLGAFALALTAPAAARAQEQELAPAAEAVVATPAAAPIDPAPAPADPAPAPPRAPAPLERLERAWLDPTRSLGERIAQTRAAASELGLSELDPLARALLIEPSAGPALERAEGAVALAPSLPAAQIALARARWDAGQPGAALAAATAALRALPAHLESRLWLEASAALLLYASVAGAGLLWIAARGLAAAPHAAHDLGDRLEASMPDFARVAAVATLALLPAALGEGLLGTALVLVAGAWAYTPPPQRRALVAAVLALALALGPLASLAGRHLGALGADVAAHAAWAAEAGFVDPVDAARLERAGDGDPLMLQALALRARRAGDLAGADARFAELVEDTADVAVLNGAANVKLELGDPAAAIELYQRAIALEPSAQLWFNLAQAHLRAIDMDSHEAALAAAQAVDPAVASELTRRLADERSGYVVEMPLAAGAVRARLLAAAGAGPAAQLRAPLAPGALGRTPWLAAVALALALAAGSVLARGFDPSGACADCGTRLCPRCGTSEAGDGVCAACARRRLEARRGGPWEAARADGSGAARVLHALRRGLRRVPGLPGSEPRRPVLGFLALLAGSLALAFALGRHGLVPDPASVAAAGPLALGTVAVGAGLAAAAFALAAGPGGEGR